MSTRILIIGNSGAGKSVLGHKLADELALPLVDLDRLHWENAGYARKREPDVARQMVAAAAAGEAWIIEGVYGWLADVALPRTTDLVWLDLPWEVCREGLMTRKASTSRPVEDRQELMAWAQAYWDRDTFSSFAGHKRIFDNFTGRKFRSKSRKEIDALVGRLAGNR